MRYMLSLWCVFVFFFVEGSYAHNEKGDKKSEGKLREEKVKPAAPNIPEPVIHPGCEFFLDGKEVKREDIKPGMEVIMTVEDGFIILIQASTDPNNFPPIKRRKK